MGDTGFAISSQSKDSNDLLALRSTLLMDEPMKERRENLPKGAQRSQELSRRFSLLPNWRMFRSSKKATTEKLKDSLMSSPRCRMDMSPKKLGHFLVEQFRPRSKSDAQAPTPGNAAELTNAAEVGQTTARDSGSRQHLAQRITYSTASASPPVVPSSGCNGTQPIYIMIDDTQTVQPCAPSLFSDALYTGRRSGFNEAVIPRVTMMPRSMDGSHSAIIFFRTCACRIIMASFCSVQSVGV
ncbi:hypothetical protein TTRE_0000317301 [Trichuris trichiura]|uniref:Uncharacterized protein n=1 Tax=Trichuris trichiura TaxID=36087 RepID=A0A077Z5G8_TRITR|nr:hypothetical protein TTRE_0000317301 [Trichuris trichiura]